MTPNIETSLQLFDAMVKPILLYNSDIWGPIVCNLDKLLENSTSKTLLNYRFPFEKLHMKWAKYILGVNSKSKHSSDSRVSQISTHNYINIFTRCTIRNQHDFLKTDVADVSKGQTDMSYKGELQTLTKLSMRHQVCHSETCRAIISESVLTMLMSRGRSNCGVTYYVSVYY